MAAAAYGVQAAHGTESTADRLFVTKIPQQATREDVAAHFSRFGVTTDVYLPAIPGVVGHKGIAFVSFSDPAAMQLAISNGPHEIQGHEVVVDVAAPRGAQHYAAHAQPYAQAPQVAAPPPVTIAPPEVHPVSEVVQPADQGQSADRLFVTKVPPVLQREHLREHFAQFGELTDVYMPAVPGGGTHKGICFVSFSDPTSLQLALQHTPHEIHGHPVVVDVAAPRGAAQPQHAPLAYPGYGVPAPVPVASPLVAPPHNMAPGGLPTAAPPLIAPPAPMQGNLASGGVPVPGRLFVTRVTPDMTKVDLQLYFQQFGQLDDVYIPTGGKGIAFISFHEAAVSQRVLQAQQHFVKPGKAVVVDQALDRPPLPGRGAPGFGMGAAQPARYMPY